MKIKALIATVAVAVASAFGALAMPAETLAVTCPAGTVHAGQDKATYAECNLDAGGNETDLMGTILDIINVIVGVLGVICVLVIVVAGIFYVTSSGDSAKTSRATKTILYAVIGLVISMLAFAIVNFVLGSVFSGGSSGGGSGSGGSGSGGGAGTEAPAETPAE